MGSYKIVDWNIWCKVDNSWSFLRFCPTNSFLFWSRLTEMLYVSRTNSFIRCTKRAQYHHYSRDQHLQEHLQHLPVMLHKSETTLLQVWPFMKIVIHVVHEHCCANFLYGLPSYYINIILDHRRSPKPGNFEFLK